MTDKDAIIDQIRDDMEYFGMRIWALWATEYCNVLSADEYLGEVTAGIQDTFESEVMKEIRKKLNIPKE